MPTTTNRGRGAGLALIWVSWADKDYISSRSLLLAGFLAQGCGLANTALEKYLKAIFTVRNLDVPRTHDIDSLNSRLVQNGVTLGLNQDFLRLLVKAYKLRYPDDLRSGFNISLVKAKVLTELDTTVFKIRKGFDIRRGGQQLTTVLDSFVKSDDARLIELICAFGVTDRAEIFARPTTCYETRVLADGNILEAYYEAGPIPDDSNFLGEGLNPSNP